ncbi:MAG TPA: zf-TFIIB domain-containing protein [Pseudomonadales bacterium]
MSESTEVRMKCPVDNETLQMTERSGVEIDYCPRCRGVWLDRGELDKIIDRGASHASGHVGHPYRAHRRKKESFLSELFDF